MKNIKFLFFVAAITILAACETTTKSLDHGNELQGFVSEEALVESMEMPVADMASLSFDQKLIKESYLQFETQNLEVTFNRIVSYVKANQGYIQNDNASKSYNRHSRTLNIRVPSNNFQATVDSISSFVSYFDEKRITLRDVTEEFVDLEARLKSKRALETRYISLLDKAKNVEEMLKIERELSKIREEIEAKQARLNYLSNRVALSTLTIEFYKITADTGVTVSYGVKMWNALKSGFDGLSKIFLGVLYIWPLLLILLVLGFVLKRWIKKVYKK